MKNVKKVIAVVLSLIMILTTGSMVAFAEAEKGSITINDAVAGQTYTIYQILDLESYNASANAYAYKATSEWNGFINSNSIKDIYVEVDAQGYVTWKDSADAAAFAKAAQKYAKDNGITDKGSKTATTTTVSFTGLALGYYLVDTTLGTLCSLDTTNPNVVMEEKNEVPTNVKTVEEDSTGTYGTMNHADIGQTVNFKSTITAQPGAENYKFYDIAGDGFTLDAASIKVDEVNVTNVAGEDIEDDNYTVVKNDNGFTIEFSDSYLDSITAATTIVITYSATLNENATIGNTGNINTSYLEYGDSSNIKQTVDSSTTTYTWGVDVFKYTMVDETETALAGATFTLSKNSDGSDPIALVSKGSNVYRVAKTGETGTVTEITTDTTGKFTVEGLDSDTYYLTETAAPAGYNKLAAPKTIVIGANGVVNGTTDAPQGVDEVKVLNQTGAELPSTGGIGTTLFYLFGAILVVGAGVVFVTRRRMHSDEK